MWLNKDYRRHCSCGWSHHPNRPKALFFSRKLLIVPICLFIVLLTHSLPPCSYICAITPQNESIFTSVQSMIICMHVLTSLSFFPVSYNCRSFLIKQAPCKQYRSSWDWCSYYFYYSLSLRVCLLVRWMRWMRMPVCAEVLISVGKSGCV